MPVRQAGCSRFSTRSTPADVRPRSPPYPLPTVGNLAAKPHGVAGHFEVISAGFAMQPGETPQSNVHCSSDSSESSASKSSSARCKEPGTRCPRSPTGERSPRPPASDSDSGDAETAQAPRVGRPVRPSGQRLGARRLGRHGRRDTPSRQLSVGPRTFGLSGTPTAAIDWDVTDDVDPGR